MDNQKKFTAPPKTVEEQIETLKGRGLLFNNATKEAMQFLSHSNYYKFCGYCKPFQKNNVFQDSIYFSDISEIYIFDQRLRILVFEAIERIELSIKANLSNIVCCNYNNPFWFLDKNNFNKNNFNKNYEQTLSLFEQILNQQKNSEIIKHFKKRYSNTYPPFWALTELLSFGQLSKLFNNLTIDLQGKISNTYELRYSDFSSYLSCLSLLRNTSHHHMKIFNNTFSTSKPAQNKKSKIPLNYKKNYFYNHYHIICYLLNKIHPNNSWITRTNKLFNGLNDKRHHFYGFDEQHKLIHNLIK